jgi:hypothetical protein
MGPLALWALLGKKFFKALALCFFFLLGVALLFGANALLTHSLDWNYQGGERKSFYFNFPFEKEGMDFDSISGTPMTAEGYFGRFLLPFKFIFYNIFYYFFGRFTGITWYFFPAAFLLLLFAIGKKRPFHWLLLAALASEILIYIVLMPDNYGGGGGSLANRYFLNIYPFFFFLPGIQRNLKQVALMWGVAAIFIAQIIVNPFSSSAYPATHAKKLPFRMLPVEMTMINNIPTNTNPAAFRIIAGIPPHRGYLHFLDDNFHPKSEPEGIWTVGSRTTEMILKTYFPAKKIIVHLLNNPRLSNEITVKVEGQKKKIALHANQRGKLEFTVGRGFQIKAIHLYKIKIKAQKGAIPYFEEKDSKERRYIGVFFSLEIIPEEVNVRNMRLGQDGERRAFISPVPSGAASDHRPPRAG